MTTSEQLTGSNIYPNWILVLPNNAWDTPSIMTVTDEEGNTTEVSIREYLAHPSSNTGLISNRQILPMPCGTHSYAPFDVDVEDITNNEALITNSGLIDGVRDFTLNDPNLAYQLPYGVFKNGFKASPLWLSHEVIEGV